MDFDSAVTQMTSALTREVEKPNAERKLSAKVIEKALMSSGFRARRGDAKSKEVLNRAMHKTIQNVFGEDGPGHSLDFEKDLGVFNKTIEKAQDHIDVQSIPRLGGR